MISTLDLLYVCLSLATLMFAGFFAYAAYHIAQVAKSLHATLANVSETTTQVTTDLVDLTSGLKYGALGLIAKLIGKKGGEETYDTL